MIPDSIINYSGFEIDDNIHNQLKKETILSVIIINLTVIITEICNMIATITITLVF